MGLNGVGVLKLAVALLTAIVLTLGVALYKSHSNTYERATASVREPAEKPSAFSEPRTFYVPVMSVPQPELIEPLIIDDRPQLTEAHAKYNRPEFLRAIQREHEDATRQAWSLWIQENRQVIGGSHR